MKKLLFLFMMLTIMLLASGCKDGSVKQIKADYVDIGYGQSLYEGKGKVDEETVQSLLKAYNEIELIGQTDEQIDYDKAITITFIYNDQISGTVVIDEKGIVHLSDQAENYQIEPSNDLYDKAMNVYDQLKKQYSLL